MLCRVCPGDGALCCKGCRSSFYCSQSCQRADWSVHKKECAGLAQKRREEDADTQELQLREQALAIPELKESTLSHGSDVDALERSLADLEVTANEHALVISELEESTRSHASDIDALERRFADLEVMAAPLTAAGAATDANLPSAAAVPSPPVPTSPPAVVATRAPPPAALDEPPADLCCPITIEVFVDPVACAGDGFTYERSEIEAHFRNRKQNNLPLTSPTTNATLTTELLIPNNRVKLLCDNWRATHP